MFLLYGVLKEQVQQQKAATGKKVDEPEMTKGEEVWIVGALSIAQKDGGCLHRKVQNLDRYSGNDFFVAFCRKYVELNMHAMVSQSLRPWWRRQVPRRTRA